MLEFILQYWLEILFGLIVAGLGWFLRKFFKMMKEEYERKHQETIDAIKTEISAVRTETLNLHNQQERAIKDLRNGLLSIQGDKFKAKCNQLLKPDHIITAREYEEIEKDHEAYNGLGGNHYGDELFRLVHKKYSNQVTQN